jgi:hypothetical protein
LNAFHISSKADRERVTRQLFQQEAQFGLAKTPEEQEAELIAEGEAAEAVRIAELAENSEAGRVKAITEDTKQKRARLEEQKRRISVEALSDSKVKQEYLDIVSELAEVDLAEQMEEDASEELPHRERQAIADAQQAAKDKARSNAHELQPERDKAVKAADRDIAQAVKSLVHLRAVSNQQAGELSRAGDRAPDPQRRRYNPDRATEALLHHLLAQNGDGLLDVGDLKQSHQPLSGYEPSPV